MRLRRRHRGRRRLFRQGGKELPQLAPRRRTAGLIGNRGPIWISGSGWFICCVLYEADMETDADLLIAAAAAAHAIIVSLVFGAVAPIFTLMVALRIAWERDVELGKWQWRRGRS